MGSFAHELRLPFPVRLENPHVVANDRVFGAVVPVGPSGKRLNSSYKFRDTDAYKTELGNVIVNVARIVPDGLLVFFPSYGVMRASKSRSTDVNDVDVWGAIIRLPRAKTDALVWHCRPFAFAGAPRTPSGDDAAPSDEARVRRGDETPSEALRGVMETFEVRDWGVFGDGG